jgi:hypothetical protein
VKRTENKLWAELRSLEIGKTPAPVQPQAQQPPAQQNNQRQTGQQPEPLKVEEESIASLDDIEEAPKDENPPHSQETEQKNEETKASAEK